MAPLMFAAVLESGAEELGGGRNLKIMDENIREGPQTGEVRPGDPVPMARVVWALVHGASLLRMDRDSAETPFIRFSMELLRAGLLQR